MSEDALDRFNQRWLLLLELRRQMGRIEVTPPVDDDFPEVKHGFDSAERAYYRCCRKQGVFDFGSGTNVLGESQPDSLRRICAINIDRAKRWHPRGLMDWSASDWGVALAGEVGELCNVIKKLNRNRDKLIGNRESPDELRVELANEIADVFLYLQILSVTMCVDLYSAVKDKFNAVSKKHRFPERL